MEQGVREVAFELKAEERYHEVRAHQLMQPMVENLEDRIRKEQKFIDHNRTKYHDLVIIPFLIFMSSSSYRDRVS